MFHILRRIKKYVVQHRPTGSVILAAVLIALVYGALGFRYIEGHTWEESIYWTVTTMSTVGYGDMSPETSWGRVHAMLLMVMGIGIFGLVVETFISILLEISERRRRGMIKVKQHEHILICGWSETVREVVLECDKMGAEVFIMSRQPDVGEHLEAMGSDATFVKGDSTRWEDLTRAGVTRASLVVIDLPTDSESLDCLITIRERTKARIVVEVERAENQSKFRFAGADDLTIPFVLSGRLIAHTRTKRYITRFVTEAVSTGVGLALEEIEVRDGDELCGKKMVDLAGGRYLADAHVVAIGRGDDLLVDTEGGLVVKAGDHLICVTNGSAAE